jgi:predicted HTH domain antitoxin
MSTFTVEVEIPQELRDIGFTEEEICREVPTLLVIKRFREGVISSGRGAQILGISRREFLALLGKDGIPIFDPDDGELVSELKTASS